MVIRCLLGVLVVSLGLAVLASTTRNASPVHPEAASTGGPRLHESEAVALSGVCRTLLRPLPAANLCFSLN